MKNICNLTQLVGLKVLSIRGFRPSDNKRKYGFKPIFILFGDKKTFIELEEQDYYTYHDCSSCVRYITLKVNEERWRQIDDDVKTFPFADEDI